MCAQPEATVGRTPGGLTGPGRLETQGPVGVSVLGGGVRWHEGCAAGIWEVLGSGFWITGVEQAGTGVPPVSPGGHDLGREGLESRAVLAHMGDTGHMRAFK